MINKLTLEISIQILTLLKDNKISFLLTKNVKSQVLTKNIDIIYYYIYGLMKEEKIYIESIFGLLILVDRLIKVLLIIRLRRYREL